MSDEIQFPQFPSLIEVRLSLEVSIPGHRPVYVEGIVLHVDRYMYERYWETGELHKWLHWQAVNHVMDNSTLQKVALNRGQV